MRLGSKMQWWEDKGSHSKLGNWIGLYSFIPTYHLGPMGQTWTTIRPTVYLLVKTWVDGRFICDCFVSSLSRPRHEIPERQWVCQHTKEEEILNDERLSPRFRFECWARIVKGECTWKGGIHPLVSSPYLLTNIASNSEFSFDCSTVSLSSLKGRAKWVKPPFLCIIIYSVRSTKRLASTNKISNLTYPPTLFNEHLIILPSKDFVTTQVITLRTRFLPP